MGPIIFFIFSVITPAVTQNCNFQDIHNYINGSIDKDNIHTDVGTPLITWKLAAELSFNQSACFALEIEGEEGPANFKPSNNQNKTQKFLEIRLTDSWQNYKVEKDYYFGIPKIIADCNCYCTDQNCSMEPCTPPDNNQTIDCFPMYFPRQECKSNQTIGSSCCTVKVIADTEKRFRALFIDSPITFFKLKWTLLDINKNVLASDNVTISTEDHEVNLTYGGLLTITEFPIVHGLNQIWCYISNDSPNDVKTHVLLNDVDEAQIFKTGWFKWPKSVENTKQFIDGIKVSFILNVDDCEANDLKWEVKGYGYENHTDKGELLQNFYNSTIEKAQFIEENMIIKVKPRDNIQLKISSEIKIAMKQTVDTRLSQFDKFIPELIYKDDNSSFISITVVNAYGELKVEVGHHHAEHILVPAINPRNFTWFVNVSERYDETFTVCVSTLRKVPFDVNHCKLVAKMAIDKGLKSGRKINGGVYSQSIIIVSNRADPKMVAISVVMSIAALVGVVFLLSRKVIRNKLILGYNKLKSKKDAGFKHVYLVEETELISSLDGNV